MGHEAGPGRNTPITTVEFLRLKALQNYCDLVRAGDDWLPDETLHQKIRRTLTGDLEELGSKSDLTRQTTLPPVLSYGGIAYYPPKRIVVVEGEGIKDTPTPRLHNLLVEFLQHPGDVVTNEQLLIVGGYKDSPKGHGAMKMAVSELRELIGDEQIVKKPRRYKYIQTIKDTGYKLEPFLPVKLP